MTDDMLQQAAEYTKNRRRRKRRQKAVTCLAAAVVFCTTYALILPAITMGREPICGLEEHTHSEACYTQVTSVTKEVPVCSPESLQLHEHTESCYDSEGELACGYADFVVHTHDASCYDEDGALWCPLPEIAAQTQAAAAGKALCFGQEEIVLHRHTADCFDENGVLLCGKTQVLEHVHTADCFETVEEPAGTEGLTCTLPEGEGHTHTALCYGEWELTCGLQEHDHSDSCYPPENDSDPAADVETRADWEKTLEDVTLTGEFRQDVLAVARSQLGYTESSRNYVRAETGPVRGYSRYGAWYGDPYGDWCAMYVSFCLSYAQVPAEDFPLDSSCTSWIRALQQEEYDLYRTAEDYTPVPGDLIFFSWDGDGGADHVGLVTEVLPATEDEPARVETIQGNSADQVRYVTYALDDREILGYGQLPEQVFYCGQPGHVHTEDCLDEDGQPVCGLEEHIHAEICMPSGEPSESALTELVFTGPDYTVRVRYDSGAALPEGVTLAADEIPADSEAYQQYYQQAAAALMADKTVGAVTSARFFDIRLQLDGETLEPAAPVSVTITYAAAADGGGDVSCRSIHFAEEGPELLSSTAEPCGDGSTSFTHIQDSFSVVGTLLLSTVESTDVGPDPLPVDYYVCIDGQWTCVGSTKTGWYGDYTTDDWSNYVRDYITVDQAESVLGAYGFDASAENPARNIAYQSKSSNAGIYSDTQTVSVNDSRIIPLTKDASHPGYNLYYLPQNTQTLTQITSPDGLDKAANGFYTVKVYDAQGVLLASAVVETGGSFTYDASASGVTSWLAAYGSGTTSTLSGSIISLENITSAVIVSPKPTDTAASHSVTFKVMIDGEWQTVGSLPYYYTGTVNGSQRAYITSAMAAQFFGDYGYTASEAPGYRFGYSYNDIYTIRYSTNTNYCIDITGGKIENGTYIQLYKSNGTAAQIFRIWDAGNGYSFITPVTNSGLHINIPSANMADGQALWIHTATDAASQWKVNYETNGTVSFQAAKNTSFYLDLDGGSTANGAKLQIWANGSNRYWKLDQQYRVSNGTVSAQNSDGTWNIGLTAESNGDIVCYYLPTETANAYTDKAETDISAANSFWSVSVRDDSHSVYSDGELSGMVQYAANGGEATVTVRNADGVLWSCRGVNGEAVDVTATQSGGYTTFTIRNITQPIEVTATRANPSFTVQYYANIPRLATSGGDAELNVIDTSGKNLPQNGVAPTYKSLQLEYINDYTLQNRGEKTQLFQVKTTTELTKLYSDATYEYLSHPDLYYFNKLKDNESYTLQEIWVLKAGRDAASTDRNDWEIHAYTEDTAFTNEAGEATGNTILISDGAVLRLVSNTSTGGYYNDTTFYDYNISSGQNSDGRWRTGITGINSESNYSASENGQRSWTSYCDVFAFGNQNCGTGMGFYLFDQGRLNSYNRRENNAYGCTFSLVDGLKKDGTIDYDDWLVVPKLFNEEGGENVTGKQTYAGSSLTFDRVGDTYTLSAATLKNSNGQSNTIDQLQYFFNPSPAGGVIWDGVHGPYKTDGTQWNSKIYTNNFWPMDQAAGKTDPLWGAYGNPGQFQGFSNSESGSRPGTAQAADFPEGDDGNAHNWFFGMNFAISFNLTADYEGPLEYYFFGDDDMWVFLDSQLVCDIGGVHSSVGEYVNLRDYLPVGSSGQHTLTFFYTERGASGSTCYMSFTLPSVSSAATSQDTGSLQISKGLSGDTAGLSDVEYQFQVELLTAENGTALNRTFSYSRSDGTYGTIKSGGTLALKANETITISGIPAGTFYRVTELSTEGYKVTVNGNEGYIVSGTMETGAVKPASFVNTPYYELPGTGGAGTALYTMGGLLLTAAGLLLLYNHFKRRKEEFTSS